MARSLTSLARDVHDLKTQRWLPVLPDAARPNQRVACQQEHAGQRIQACVDGRQVVNRHNRFAIIAIHKIGR